MTQVLQIYVLADDLALLFDLLDPDIAFIAPDGERRWKATRDRPRHNRFHLKLWHEPGGPPVVVSGERKPATVPIADPWAGWEEKRAPHLGSPLAPGIPAVMDWRDDPRLPGIETACPNFVEPLTIFDLLVSTVGLEKDSLCGLTTLGWIGKKYALAGLAPPDVTIKRWAKLRRDIAKHAVKVPRGGPAASGPPEIWAFPHAATLTARCDLNPYTF